MGIAIEAGVTIGRWKEEVAAYAMDPANDPTWIGGIREVRLLTPPPLAAGSRVARVAYFLFRRIEYVLEVESLEPETRIAMRSVSGPFSMQVRYRFDAVPEGTRVLIDVAGDPSPLFRIAAPIMAWMVRRNVSRDLRTLKRLLEAGSD